MNRVKYLDGLRGLAALVVVLNHFFYCFYPATLLGNPALAHNPFELIMAKSPLNIVYNGDFAVCIFFVLSGFVLSIPYFTSSKDKYTLLTSAALRRYPRLIIPMVVSCLFAYLLLKLGWMYNQPAGQITKSGFLEGFYKFDASMIDLVKQTFYSIFFNNGISTYDPVLWTMKVEFLGSLLVFTILALIGTVKRRAVLYSVLIVVFFNSYYLSFLSGLIMCDLMHNRAKIIHLFGKQYIKYPLLLVSLYLGSFPVIELPGFPGSSFYDFMKITSLINYFNLNPFVLSHNIGAALLLLFVLISMSTQKILSKPVFQWLGKVSFPAYLIHLPIICSLSSFLFIKLVQYVKYDIAYIVTVISSFVVIGILSHILNKYVDKPAIKLAKSISEQLVGEQQQTKLWKKSKVSTEHA